MNTEMRWRHAYAVRAVAAVAGLSLAAGGCASESSEGGPEDPIAASVEVESTDGDDVTESVDASVLTAELRTAPVAAGDYPDAAGTAVLTVDDGTSVELSVTGLLPEVEYIARLHDEPCADDPPGGDHWSDPEGTPSVHSDLWLEFTADAEGSATAAAESDLLGDEPIRSIVVFVDDGDDQGHRGSDLILCGDFA